MLAKQLYVSIVLIAMLFNISLLSAQGWERQFPEVEEGWAAIPTVDGGYVITGREGIVNATGADDIFLLRVDPDGKQIWKNTYGGDNLDQALDIIEANDGSYIVVGNTNSLAPSSQIYVANIDSTGALLWQNHYGNITESDRSRAVTQASDGNFLVTGCLDCFENPSLFILKLDPSGQEIWLKNFPIASEGFSIMENSVGEIVVTGRSITVNSGTDIAFLKTDANADVILLQGFYGQAGDDRGESIIETSDGNYALTATTREFDGAEPDIWLIKVSNVDASIPSGFPKSFGGNGADFGHAIVETPEGDLAIAGGTWLGLNGNSILIKTDADGNEIWRKDYGSIHQETSKDLFQLADGGFLLTGNSKVNDTVTDTALSSGIYLIKTDALGNTLNNYISGRVIIDDNNNCAIENEEQGLEDWVIKVAGTETFYGTTDADGYFNIPISGGNYEVEVILPNAYWNSCQIIPTTSVSAYDTIDLELPIQKITDCEDLQVDISAPYLNRCAFNDYIVRYCNQGTRSSSNAYIEVQLDEDFIFNSSTVTATNLGNNLYRFDIGDVDIEECGNFTIRVFVNCFSTIVGQTHCMEAQIFPDDICLTPNPNWDNSSIKVDGDCLGSNIEFTISNIGTAPTSEVLGYIITEDQIIFREGKMNINALQDTTIIIENPQGKMYRLEMQQAEDHPGRSMPSKAIEACNAATPADISLGFVTQYPEDDADVFRSIDCQESVVDYQPNEKRAFPKGYIEDINYIKPNTDIEYHIRFQNNFTDTVSRVIILDTLSAFLDPATVKAGVSSHDYQFEVYRNGIVKFEFSDIQLLDSLNNLNESVGYVKFRVSQLTDVAPNAVIKNTAGIYYNFNAPLNSSMHCHTVAKHAVYGSDEITACENMAYPNDTIVNDTIPMVNYDSVTVLNIIAQENRDTAFNETICNGDAYEVGDTSFMTSGDHVHILPASNGCDSMVMLNLTLLTTYEMTFDTSLLWGSLYKNTVVEWDTTFTEVYQAANGCDSTIITNVDIITTVENPNSLLQYISLYPNPSSGDFQIEYILKEASPIRISLLNALGTEIRTIDKIDQQNSGRHILATKVDDLPDGLYLIQIETSQSKILKKLIKGA